MRYTAIICTFIFALMAGFASAGEKAPEKVSDKDGKKYAAITARQFKKMLPGNIIVGEYRFMRERTKTFHFNEAHHANGTTDYTEGSIKSKGIWYTLSTHKICYKYPNDPNMGAQISCFWVYKQDTCYYGYSIANMTLKGPRNYDDWSARWIVKGSGGTCDAPVS